MGLVVGYQGGNTMWTKRLLQIVLVTLLVWGAMLMTLDMRVSAHEPHQCPDGYVDGPVIPEHIQQESIVNKNLKFSEIFDAGARLFSAVFNKCDGRGRPSATGNGAPTKRIPDQPEFIRTSAPDANSCAGCHAQPRAGGGGDFVANVFVLAQVLDPVTYSVSSDFSDERNTLGMMGAGPIEALGREMTADLHAIRDAAIAEALATGVNVTKSLDTKGVNFGSMTAHPDGTLDTSLVQGVDADLIIKPFHQKGVVRSIREFTVNAFNHHHGMQSVERFGTDRTGTSDFDEDGIPDEMTIGDITAATIWQAALGTPGQVIPTTPAQAEAVKRGEQRFNEIGCATCHKPSLVLNNPVFCEPNPFNPPGTFGDTSQSFCFDMTREGEKPRLEKGNGGKVIVQAYTDLKRHKICDEDYPHFCNEKLVQGGVPTDQFITRKLWDVGNSAPYGHRGDLTTLTEAILAHGAEGKAARDNFAELAAGEQADIVVFLKSLQILPAGSPINLSQDNHEKGRKDKD
jgi:mono/diheme cytochrome c family protein